MNRISDPEWARREGLVAFAGHPLLRDHQLAGVMALFARRPLEDFTLAALASVADTITLAIQGKRAEEDLRATRHRLEHVIASNPAVLFTLSVEGETLTSLAWVSENLREMMGYSPQEALGKQWWHENLHPDDRDRVTTHVSPEVIAHGRFADEYRFRHREAVPLGASASLRWCAARTANLWKWSAPGRTSPSARTSRSSSARRRRWRRSAGWPAAWPTTSTTC